MTISRRLGILVFFGVPAIFGGGIIIHLTGSMLTMWVYQIMLYLFAGALISK